MKLRPFGNTGMTVSEIGLGAWQLANPDWGIDDKREALRIIQKSLEAGCNFFDTAPGYGSGRSEELLGEGLKSVRRDVILCTKFSHYGEDGTRDFEARNIRPVLEGSLRALQSFLLVPEREQALEYFIYADGGNDQVFNILNGTCKKTGILSLAKVF